MYKRANLIRSITIAIILILAIGIFAPILDSAKFVYASNETSGEREVKKAIMHFRKLEFVKFAMYGNFSFVLP